LQLSEHISDPLSENPALSANTEFKLRQFYPYRSFSS